MAEIMARIYERDSGPDSFEAALYDHLRHGWVVSGPDQFAMFRPVSSSWDEEAMKDRTRVAENPDCWFLYLGKTRGSYLDFFRWEPTKLPFVAFHVSGKLRVYSRDNATKLLLRLDRRPDLLDR